MFRNRCLLAGLAAVFVLWPPYGLFERSHPQFAGYFADHPIDRGTTYRVLTTSHREDGMVEFLRRDAVLSTEFFTESIFRKSFASTEAYACLLGVGHVGHVALTGDYQRAYSTNEIVRLDELVARGEATREYQDVNGTVVYRISLAPRPVGTSIRGCHI